MKTLKLNIVRIAALAIIGATSCIINPAVAGSPASSATEDKYQKENAIIRDDIMAIKLVRERIKQLEVKYKKDKVAGREEAMIAGKSDLLKAKADLNWNENYLAADKKVLVLDRKLGIKYSRNEIKKDRENLSAYKTKLDKDVAKGNETALAEDASKVVYYQNELKRDKVKLSKEKEYLNNDLVAINKEIQKVNGQFIAVTYSETAYANVNNWLNK